MVWSSAVFDYRYSDISLYRIISISTPVISKLSIWRRTIQPAVRLDERVSRWFNLTGGRRRVNYLARQRTAGSRGRQSPIVGVRGVAYYWRVNRVPGRQSTCKSDFSHFFRCFGNKFLVEVDSRRGMLAAASRPVRIIVNHRRSRPLKGADHWSY